MSQKAGYRTRPDGHVAHRALHVAAPSPHHDHSPGARQADLGGSKRILVVMKSHRAFTRRLLPTSPFSPPPALPPAEQYAVRDQVTHDTYGLGRVFGVEPDIALAVDFGSHRVRIVLPCAKLTKL